MRLGLLSDIHGNVLALEAVVADARSQGISRFVDLGDILYGPLWPRETYELLQRLDVVATIRGNQDRDVYEDEPASGVNPVTRRRVRDAIGPAAIEWLRALPATARVDDVYACHGAPGDDLLYLLERVESGGALLRDGEAIDRSLAGVVEPVVLCGHTHVPRCVRTPGGKLVVNPGSVGLPAFSEAAPCPHVMETGSPDASYAVLERTPAAWLVRHVRVPYRADVAADRARAEGRDDWAAWLATGRGSA